MTAVQKIEAAEAASHAMPCCATPSRTTPSLGPHGRAKDYHDKLKRLLAATGSLYCLSDILIAIDKGDMQSFVEGNSWILTRICLYPRAKALEVFAAIGDLDDLRILHDRVIDFAAEIGAGVIRAYGRKGWLPDAARRGWKVKARYFVYQRDC